ncbi:MAG: acetyl-CoA hydrolase/transferase C-terminal domain-containing protein [Myxococcota bacterium]
MDSHEKFQRKLISVDQALGLIKSNYEVVSALAASEASGVMSRLHTIKDRVEGVSVVTCLPMQDYEFFTNPDMKGHFFHEAWFYSPGIRKAHHAAGTSSFVPNHLHAAGSDRLSFRKPNVFLGSCTPANRHGYVSLSLSATYEREMIEAADLAILEVNENLPFTYGDTLVHLDEIDYVIESHRAIPELPAAKPSEKDRAIGSYISDLIEDGSTLQLGIGGIPNAVATALLEKKDIGIHTEMFTDGMVDLYHAGVISRVPHAIRERVLSGKMVAAFALGTGKLYDFLDHNPAVAMMQGAWVNDPYVISRNHRQISINTALEVDLVGQVCSETIGHRQFSGTGGQADTAIGAQMSKGGKSFIALYSTANVAQPDGSRRRKSKIVAAFPRGACVTLHRANVDYIVTEYGMVRLKGCSVRERVKRLISIAHPDFRDELGDEARAMDLI